MVLNDIKTYLIKEKKLLQEMLDGATSAEETLYIEGSIAENERIWEEFFKMDSAVKN